MIEQASTPTGLRLRRRLQGAIAALALSACALGTVPGENLSAPAATPAGILVFGRVTYVIDGETKLPYGPRPAVPSPHFDLLLLESGNSSQRLP